MLANIIDVDCEAMQVSLRRPHEAVLLFDFEVAFRSESHEYLWSVFSHLGLPAGISHAIQLVQQELSFDSCQVHVLSQPDLPVWRQSRLALSPIRFGIVAVLVLRSLGDQF